MSFIQKTDSCHQIMNMSIRDILTEWGQTIQGFIHDLTNTSSYQQLVTNQPTSRLSLLVSTFTRGRRMFYLGLTLVLISVLLLFWDQPDHHLTGGYPIGHLGNLVRI